MEDRSINPTCQFRRQLQDFHHPQVRVVLPLLDDTEHTDQGNQIRQGAQGNLDAASKATLENEFGTKNEDEAIIKILETGNAQNSEVWSHKDISSGKNRNRLLTCVTQLNANHPGRGGDRNDTIGGRQAH